MNEFNSQLQENLTEMANLKRDLSDVERLLVDKPVDTGRILQSMDEEQARKEELVNLIPKLKTTDTKKLTDRAKSVSNDQLFIAFMDAFETHNKDLIDFKKMAERSGKENLTRRANELRRLALKQR